MEWQPSEWEKIFANEAMEKELIYKVTQTAHAVQFQKNNQCAKQTKKKGQKT